MSMLQINNNLMLRIRARTQVILAVLVALVSTLVSLDAAALPLFARQTGHNCIACHAGGQFPELTPYGRLFKLTAFTIGKRATVPFAVMGVFGSTSSPNNPTTGAGSSAGNGTPTFLTGSLFFGGKMTDNIGMFLQYTWNNYAFGGIPPVADHFKGNSDNFDIRYANHVFVNNNDIIYGVDMNNNPGLADVWNSSQTYGYGIVPTSTGGYPGYTILDGGLGQQVVSQGVYVYLNRAIYAEFSAYQTGNGVYSFVTQNNGGQVGTSGVSPYLRLAATHEWGAQNIMLGYTFFNSDIYENGFSGPTDRHQDNMVDVQYQYLLDPHTFTAEASRINEVTTYGSGGPSGGTNETKAKVSYTYLARYGADLAYYNVSDNQAYESAYQAATGTPLGNTVAFVPEVFFLPIQNVRIGLQYTMFRQFASQTSGASNNNTTFLYLWGAY